MPRFKSPWNFHYREFCIGLAVALGIGAALYMTVPGVRTHAQSGAGGSTGGTASYGTQAQTTTQRGVSNSTVGSPEVGAPSGSRAPGEVPEATRGNRRPLEGRVSTSGSMAVPGGNPFQPLNIPLISGDTIPGIEGAPVEFNREEFGRNEFSRLFPETTVPSTFAQLSPNPLVDVPDRGRLLAQATLAIDNAANDALLRNQMQAVSNWLQDYTVRNQRWPSFGDNMMWAEQQLAMLVPGNPYLFDAAILTSGNTLPPAGLVSPPVTLTPTPGMPGGNPVPSGRVRLYIDQSLNGNVAEQFITDPPLNWVAEPGSISAISNAVDFWLVWGAGADGLPIRDPQTGNPYLIFGRWGFPP